MKNLKVGDKVRIKEWDDMVEEYGLDTEGDIMVKCSFVQSMSKFCGEVVTISKVVEDDLYEIEEDDTGYMFSTDMFKSIEDDSTFLYPELKNGQVVKLRGRDKPFIIIKNGKLYGDDNYVDLLIERHTGCFLEIDGYLGDLTDEGGFSQYDIMEIYELNYVGEFFDTRMSDDDIIARSELRWGRVEKYAEVICNGQQYTTYDGFLRDNFPEYLDKFEMDCDVENGTICKVLGHAPHEWKHDELYVIENDEGQVFIVGEDGLRFLD